MIWLSGIVNSSCIRARGPADILVWGPVVFWMAVIFVLSSQSSLPGYHDQLIDVLIKKSGHATEYAILTLLAFRSFSLAGSKWLAARPRLWALVLSVAYAGLDEFHQSFTPNRHPQFSDVLIDTLGILVALLAIRWWSCHQRNVAE